MYKPIFKNTSWENISRAEYGATSQANNLEKLNNKKDNGEVIVYREEYNSINNYNRNNKNDGNNNTENLNTTNNQDLYIEINNSEIKEFISIELLHSITAIRSAILHLHRIDDIKIFDSCSIYYGNNTNNKNNKNNNLFLKGYIKNIIPTLNSENNSYIIQIKSYAGILVDSVVPQELEFINSNLKEIIEQICSVYNIKVEFDQSNKYNKSIIEYKINNEIDNSASAKLNETAWSFITRLCNSRGLLVQDNGNGTIYIGSINKNINTIIEKEKNLNTEINKERNTNQSSKYSFILGDSSIYNWLPIYNYDNLARYYEIYSQFNSNSKELITLEAIKLPITKRIINNEINEGILKEYGNWIVCREIGKAIKLQIDINGTLNNSIKELNVGDMINIQNKLIGFEEETEMLIESKIIKYQDKTTLILTLPCAYNGVIPERLPFMN